jgi:murein DD-endopeptidase MepM/ murein hydrolase activator NlpD
LSPREPAVCPPRSAFATLREREARPSREEAPTIARKVRLRTALALALALGALGLSPAFADTKQDLDRAEADLAQIQGELNRATAVWQSAIGRLDQTKAEILSARVRISGIERRLERIDERLARRAVVAFTSGPASTIDLLLSSSSFTDFSDRLEFLGSVAQEDVDLSLEQLNAQEDLRREREDLLSLSERQAEVAAELRAAQEIIDEQFGRIQDRVADLTAKYRQEQAAQRELQVLGQSPDPSSPIQVCPVAGPNAFVDSFGWPRDGHTHQGIDLISPAGTPIVAAHPGIVSHSSSSSGGIQAYVRAPSGTYTFYAHLSGYSSASGSVGAGTVIGYVGSTGNAGSTNHLHFEYHPGGGAAINPYQMLVGVC